jgi:hypothetical protein
MNTTKLMKSELPILPGEVITFQTAADTARFSIFFHPRAEFQRCLNLEVAQASACRIPNLTYYVEQAEACATSKLRHRRNSALDDIAREQ